MSDHNVCSVLAVAEQRRPIRRTPWCPTSTRLLSDRRPGRQAAHPEFMVQWPFHPIPHRQELCMSASTNFAPSEMSEIFEDMTGSVP